MNNKTDTSNEIKVLNRPSREQLEQIYDILGDVFPVEIGRDYFQTRLDQDSSYDPATTWFATVNDVIASTVQIFPLTIRVGTASLLVGGMGSVGTAENYRGMGLAHRILNAQTSWMKQEGYDLSLLLASKHRFYEKVGWRLIPEKIYSLPMPSEAPSPSGYTIVPFEEGDLADIRRLYEQFNHGRTYSLIRNETYWNDMMTWPEWTQADCLLLKKGDSIVAYGIIEQVKQEQVFISELIYAKEAEDGVKDLFLALCQLRSEAKQVLIRFSDDHALTAYYKQHDADSFDMNISMWKIINLCSTLQKLQPELQRRLQAYSETLSKPIDGARNDIIHNEQLPSNIWHIALQCGSECVYLDYENQHLSVTPESKPAHNYQTITINEKELVTLIIFGYDEQLTLDSEHNELLQALFPKQQAMFYLTDKF